MTVLGSTWLYYTLPCHYWALQLSTMALLGSTRLDHTVMTLFDSTTLYHGSTLLFHTLLHALYTMTLHLPPLDSTILYHGSTWVYWLLLYTVPWLYLALLDSTTVYHCYSWLYCTLLHQLYDGSTWFYLTLLDSTTLYLAFPWLSYIIPQLYLGFLDCTWIYTALYRDSTWLHCTLLQSTMPLLASTWFYCTLLWLYYIGSTWLYYTLPWLNLTLLYSTTLQLHYRQWWVATLKAGWVWPWNSTWQHRLHSVSCVN